MLALGIFAYLVLGALVAWWAWRYICADPEGPMPGDGWLFAEACIFWPVVIPFLIWVWRPTPPRADTKPPLWRDYFTVYGLLFPAHMLLFRVRLSLSVRGWYQWEEGLRWPKRHRPGLDSPPPP